MFLAVPLGATVAATSLMVGSRYGLLAEWACLLFLVVAVAGVASAVSRDGSLR